MEILKVGSQLQPYMDMQEGSTRKGEGSTVKGVVNL